VLNFDSALFFSEFAFSFLSCILRQICWPPLKALIHSTSGRTKNVHDFHAGRTESRLHQRIVGPVWLLLVQGGQDKERKKSMIKKISLRGLEFHFVPFVCKNFHWFKGFGESVSHIFIFWSWRRVRWNFWFFKIEK